MRHKPFLITILSLYGVVLYTTMIGLAADAEVIVAASNSGAEWKGKAKYICDGTSDQTEIINAIADVATGGTVTLSEGTFNISDSIVITKGNLTVKGQGENATILNFIASASLSVKQANITLKDFQFTGKGRLFITYSHNKLYNVKAYKLDNLYIAAFSLYATSKFIEDVQFYNCKVIDCDRWGFLHTGEGSAQQFGVRNILYDGCQAIRCGYYNQYYGVQGQYSNAWDVGFDVMESLGGVAEDVTYKNCLADSCWENGFYVEVESKSGTTYCRNVRFLNCTSRNNGIHKQETFPGGAKFGGGWIVATGMYLEDCVAENNINGYHCSGRGGVFERCKDIGSQTGFLIHLVTTSLTMNNCEVQNSPQPVYFWTGNTKNIVVDNLKVTSSTPRNSAGVLVENLVKDPVDILIKNSYIQGYKVGVENKATARGLTKVSNVTVVGATTAFIGCDNITPPGPQVFIANLPSRVAGTVAFTATVSGGTNGIKEVRFKLNNTTLLGTDTTSPYTYKWDTTQVSDGGYTITAEAEDNAGNVNKANAFVIVDNTGPTISFFQPLNGAQVSGVVPIQVQAGDDAGVSKVSIKVNGALLAESQASYSFNWDTAILANGFYTLEAIGQDTLGNESTASINVEVNNDGPLKINISYPQAGNLVKGLYKIRWNTRGKNNAGATINLYYQRQGTDDWCLIAYNEVNDGECTWDTAILGVGGLYRVKAIAKAGESEAIDCSDWFTIIKVSGRVTHGPNPASNQVTFYFGEGVSGRLQIYDVAGRLVWSTQVAEGMSSLSWDLSNTKGVPLANGLYLYTVVDEQGGKVNESKLLVIVR